MKALLGESNVRITYADGDLMLMSPGFSHEAYKFAICDLVRAVARAAHIKTRSLGSTYWEGQGVGAGKEPDASYYVAHTVAFGRSRTTENAPVPDLVIEIEITNPIRLSLLAYAALGVPELWHFSHRPGHQAVLRFLRLDHKEWIESPTSLSFPMLESSAIVPLIEEAVPLDDEDREDLIAAWAREHLRATKRRKR